MNAAQSNRKYLVLLNCCTSRDLHKSLYTDSPQTHTDRTLRCHKSPPTKILFGRGGLLFRKPRLCLHHMLRLHLHSSDGDNYPNVHFRPCPAKENHSDIKSSHPEQFCGYLYGWKRSAQLPLTSYLRYHTHRVVRLSTTSRFHRAISECRRGGG